MRTDELIREIQKLPVSERLYLIEQSMHLIRKQIEQSQMKAAAVELQADYESDKNVTDFTSLDLENFYETR